MEQQKLKPELTQSLKAMRNYTFLSMFRKYVNSSLILIIVTIVA